jgi:hypothetical protein
VTPQQATLLAVADVNTILRLTLRSPDESVRSLLPDPISFSVPLPVTAVMPSKAGPPAPAPAAKQAQRSSGPVIIDGDRVTSADNK